MLKKLPVAVKMTVGSALIVGAIVLMTYEDQRATSKYQRICQEQIPKVSSGAGEENAASGKECDEPKDYMPWWYKLVAWPDGIGGWALIATGFVIGWQSYETRKAASAARDSIRLQEAGMRQWVNVVPLRVQFPPNFMETGEANIQFEVVNRTDYLLTIIQSEVEIMPNIQTSRKFTVNCDVPLVPQKSAQDSSYTFYGTAYAPVEGWSDEGKIFIVGGTVTYRDAVGVRQTQEFHDLYRGYLDGRLELMKPSGLVPEEEPSKS